MSAVQPESLTLAPRARSFFATSSLPLSAAIINAVSPKRLRMFTSARPASSASTVDAEPLRAATISTGSPLASRPLGSAPRASSVRTSPARSLATAIPSSSAGFCANTRDDIAVSPNAPYRTISLPAIRRRPGRNSRGMRFQSGIDPEKTKEIGAGLPRDRLDRHFGEARDFLCDVRHERRLIALAAIRNRREIRRIGLDQHPVARHATRNVLQRERVLERHDAGERDVEPLVDRGARDVPCLGEAMHNAPRLTRALLAHDGERVVAGGSRVDHERLARGARRAD